MWDMCEPEYSTSVSLEPCKPGLYMPCKEAGELGRDWFLKMLGVQGQSLDKGFKQRRDHMTRYT